jgi:glucokinase
MIELITAIGVGIVLGMYITSQITKSICENIEYKEFLKNFENYEKKKTK